MTLTTPVRRVGANRSDARIPVDRIVVVLPGVQPRKPKKAPTGVQGRGDLGHGRLENIGRCCGWVTRPTYTDRQAAHLGFRVPLVTPTMTMQGRASTTSTELARRQSGRRDRRRWRRDAGGSTYPASRPLPPHSGADETFEAGVVEGGPPRGTCRSSSGHDASFGAPPGRRVEPNCCLAVDAQVAYRKDRRETPCDGTGRTVSAPPRCVRRLFWVVQRAVYSVTRGRFGLQSATADRQGMLRLRRSDAAQVRNEWPSSATSRDSTDLVTMAMNGWADPEPAWWLNLQAARRHGRSRWWRAPSTHSAAEDKNERPRLWARWAGYDKDLDAFAVRRSRETASSSCRRPD